MERTIKSKIKRLASLLLAVAMLASVVPSALASPADDFTDFPTGWSKPAMEAAVYNGLLVGIGEGEIGPQKNLTRAEMAAVMVRAFGATTKADVSAFVDLDESSWYYDSIASAVQMGALAGISSSEMAPEENITREQVFSVLARILALNGNDSSVLSKFNDRNEISGWAMSTVIPMVERGYVNGDNFGNINPKAYITREEFAQVMYTAVKKYITEPGTYEEDLDGIVVLRTGNVTLSGMTVTGDLVVGDGAAKDSVILEDVKVNGRLLTRGGTITLKKSKVSDCVVVLNPNGNTKFNNYRTDAPFDDVIEHTKAIFMTHGGSSSGGSIGDIITVNFYKGSGKTDKFDSERIILRDGIAKVSALPDIGEYYWDGGFEASKYMPADYDITNETYKAKPSFWYQDGGEWKPFDETVVLTKDTDVHLMYRKASVSVLGAEIFVRYDSDTRLMDSAKLFAHQTYKALEKAKKSGLPLYDSVNANIQSILNGTGWIEEEDGKQYLKPFLFDLALSNALKEEDVKDVVEDRIKTIIKKIEEPEFVDKLLQWPGADEYISSGLTNDEIISKVKGMDEADIAELCEKICASDEYKEVVDAIKNNGDFVITPENFKVFKEIHKELEKITFDTVMSMSNSPISGMTSVLGYDVCEEIFNGGRIIYCEELAELIANVESETSAEEKIPSAFTLVFDIIGDILKPLYEKAEDKMVNKFSESVRYSENPYLQYLVSLDTISELFGYDGPVPAGQEEIRTGYYIKDLTEYAEYMVKLLIATDDALCWYGDLTDAEFEKLYNDVFADIFDLHDKIDKIMQDFYYGGKLPGALQTTVESVQQIADIFDKFDDILKSIIGGYFDTTIYEDLSNHRPGENSMKIAEILAGREDVTFTIDSFYAAVDNNEEKIQEMLGSFSGSINDIAKLLKEKLGVREDLVDGIVGVIGTITAKGFGEYRQTPTGTTIDLYSVPFGGYTISLKRSLEM